MIPDIYIDDESILKNGWVRENIDFPIPQSADGNRGSPWKEFSHQIQ